MVSTLDDNATMIAQNPNVIKQFRNIQYSSAPSAKWAPEITASVKELDDVHTKLIHMVNALHDAESNGTGDKLLGNIFVGLISYMAVHFADEERLLRGSELNNQKLANEKQLNYLLELKQQFMSGKPNVSHEVSQFMKVWLANEISNGGIFVRR